KLRVEDGELAIRLNRNCIEPEISPVFAICQGVNTEFFATNAAATTYNWNIIGTGSLISQTGNAAVVNITGGTSVTIEAEFTQAGSTCTSTASQTFVVTTTQTPDPVIQVNGGTPPSTLCVDDHVILSTSASFGTYLWTMPDGSDSTSSTINLGTLAPSDAGTYSLIVTNPGNCSSEKVDIDLNVTSPPTSIEIFNNGFDTFCSDGSNDPQLEVSNITGVSYQWLRNGIATGATGPTFTATESGDYSVRATVATCPATTDIYTITEVTAPSASISGPPETCVNFETRFISTSILESGFTTLNSWTVEDASNNTIGTSSSDTLDFTFPAPGTYAVILSSSYDPAEVASCMDAVTQLVTVSDLPMLTFNVGDVTEKCQLDTLPVSLTSPNASTISNYNWIIKNALTGRGIDTLTDASVNVVTPTGVDSVYAVVTMTSTIGCQVNDSVLVKNLPTDVDIAAIKFDISGDSVTLEDDNFIDLSAVNVVSDVAWSPSSIITDTTSSNISVFPSQPFTTVTLKGTDSNGCLVASTVVIELDNIRPRRTFSPNNDGLGFDCWEILNTSSLPDCKVFVFDSRGKNILVKNSPFENNCVWDGTSSGASVPEGVYYFVLKCNDVALSKSGSILLAR
ncbi:MAG: gliding motility-associated C-terminal domain-containing protein, partial [Bacteroidota bacterium]